MGMCTVSSFRTSHVSLPWDEALLLVPLMVLEPSILNKVGRRGKGGRGEGGRREGGGREGGGGEGEEERGEEGRRVQLYMSIGDNSSSNPFWNFVRDLLKAPSKEQVACHHPKPILLDTGEMNFPYPWEPKIMPVQILRIGQFVIVGVPGEFT